MATGNVYFRLPVKAEAYFQPIMKSSQKFELAFDYYYLCLLVGILAGKLGRDEDVKDQYLVDSYPGPYKTKRGVLAGLLIEAEMRRQDILPQDRQRLQQLILTLTSHNDTFLSEEGVNFLNLYAAGGMELIEDNIPTKTASLPTFLTLYHQLIDRLGAEQETWSTE